MTLAQIISQYEARQPHTTPPLDFVPAAVALTARGDAAIALYRFLRQLRCLGDEDRAYILGMLAEELPTATVSSGMRLLGCPHPTSCADTRECRARPQ